MTHSRKFVAMLACCGAVSAALVGHASAGQASQERFHDEGTLVHENFCGVEGLTVSDEFVIDGRVHTVPHGRNRFDYFLENRRETSVVTNVADDNRTVTFALTVHQQDLKVTDNGDGTLTIVTMFTGNVVVSGPDGKAIARDPGQARFEALIDHGGTPNDPSDDEFISERLIKGSTGRSDDICAAVVSALA